MSGNPEEADLDSAADPRDYQLWRVRADRWNALRDSARRLARGVRSAKQAAQLKASCHGAFRDLAPLERCFAFPGHRAVRQLEALLDAGDIERFANRAIRLVRYLTTGAYRRLDLLNLRIHDFSDLLSLEEFSADLRRRLNAESRPYFEVLLVDELTPAEGLELQRALRALRHADDPFIYEVVVVGTWERALLAAMANPTLQAAILRYSFPFTDGRRAGALDSVWPVLGLDPEDVAADMPGSRTRRLGAALTALRPELDAYLVSDAPVEDVVGPTSRMFRRIFYQAEDYADLHLSILRGVEERYETPFFSALKRHALKPTGLFHALPVARGKSIARSHWIRDLEEFYGPRAFQAESSATTAGLDSLLQPVGNLKRAQQLAARAFGARHTYFVTNGTSTANKIVMQALLEPGDIVLLSHDCHKSHPYAVILAGAQPLYLDAYPLSRYSMYGGVPIEEIKRRLLNLRRQGKLERAKLLLLTNITFDGITYDPERVMEEVLAIKPDIAFLWDEAWFAYGRCSPTLRRRTAMATAERLRARLVSDGYRAEYEAWRSGTGPLDPDDDDAWLRTRLRPDPSRARVRVYATQSTHKTLTSLRQGSMIHIHDQDFEHGVRTVFNEAYMTHTSTSPNLQILGSLDVGRRQVELEGFDLVQRSLELAMLLRERIRSDPHLNRYFRVLSPADMVPEAHRPSGLEAFYDVETGGADLSIAWTEDEFVLDPTRITVDVGRTGMEGDEFKKMLMDRFAIQVNKTSRNTVLFMTHIATTRGMVAHLVKVLSQIADELDADAADANELERALFDERVRRLVEELPPLPYFSTFHPAFAPDASPVTREGDMRTAFFQAYDDDACEYLKLDGAVARAMEAGRTVVSARFVTPYPPGFPVLVPGQVITEDILAYLKALDVKEIHGYEPAYGLRVFREDALTGPPPSERREVDPSKRTEREKTSA